MLKTITVIDNIFDDPDSMVQYAHRMQYYTRDKHPQRVSPNWTGQRTCQLADVTPDEFSVPLNEIMTRVVGDFLSAGSDPVSRFTCDINYKTQTYFHLLTKDCQWSPNWIHRDENNFLAGVVYLSKNPPPNTGTIIYNDGGTETHVTNVFNRLVLYRGSLKHCAQSGYGTDLKTGRLTYTMFFNSLQLSITPRGLDK